LTEGSVELLVPPCESCQDSPSELATGASARNPDAEGLKGASDPRAPLASTPQDAELAGAEAARLFQVPEWR